jgi:hypothetical protein
MWYISFFIVVISNITMFRREGVGLKCVTNQKRTRVGEGGGAGGSLGVVTWAAFIAEELWENCKD